MRKVFRSEDADFILTPRYFVCSMEVAISSKPKLIFIISKPSVRTSKETQATTIIEIISLMPFKEVIALYSEKHQKLVNTLYRQNMDLLIVKNNCTHSYH
jgi:hypothetical protein